MDRVPPEEVDPAAAQAFAIDASDRPSRASLVRRRKRPAWQGLLLVSLGAVALGLIIVLGLTLLPDAEDTLRLEPLADRQVAERATLRFTAALVDPPADAADLTFSLLDAPEGATIDRRSGEFSWTPTEKQGPGWYTMRIRVVAPGDDAGKPSRQDECEFGVSVEEVNQPPVVDPIEPKTARLGSLLSFNVVAADPDEPARPLEFRLLGNVPEGARIDPRTGEFQFSPVDAKPGEVRHVTVGVVEAVPGGLGTKLSFDVRVERPATPRIGPPVVAEADTRAPGANTPAVASPKTTPLAETAAQAETASAQEAIEQADQAVLELYRKNRFFQAKDYPALRKVFARRFQREYAPAIADGFGEHAEEITRWLDEHAAIKEDLYTAIDPAHDDVPAALRLFGQLVRQFPAAFPDHADLAIAVAVTWDDPKGRGIEDYRHHQRRTRGVLPPGEIGPVENFQYVFDADRVMQGRGKFLPWEFLVHVVNHRTPPAERAWAVAHYGDHRAMIGECYRDVPYDTGMLDTQGETTRLDGKDYTLENLQHYGGVCSMQADFASRVAKSLGVPAAQVTGEARGGDHHAWVMWVELLGASGSSIQFDLKSFGRYRGDLYYVGHLRDPQTGEEITDRDLELRLHTVGLSARNKRHAALMMRAYPMLAEKTDMNVADRLRFLKLVIQLSPGNEDAWLAVAGMSKDGVVTNAHNKAMMVMLRALFSTFAQFPDFTWKVFNDLITFQSVPKQRAALYEQLVASYVEAKRPDLACEAVLAYADDLVKDGHEKEAVAALSTTIMAFPDEGRYVPKMLDKLEAVSPKLKDGDRQVLSLYQSLLPKVPPRRGNRPSPYCIEMYRRAIKRFTDAGQPELAEVWKAALAKLEEK